MRDFPDGDAINGDGGTQVIEGWGGGRSGSFVDGGGGLKGDGGGGCIDGDGGSAG